MFIIAGVNRRMQSKIQSQILCVAHPSVAGGWEALCLDFDIAVQAATFDEAKGILKDAIATYIEDAMKEDEPHKSRLLKRRAPLWVRLMWGWRFFVDTVRDRRDDGKNVAVGFPVSCPA